ncbi:MAG: hypothetical protein Q7S64_00595 [bacterium]|nr:hypothetical protein [bacterium]
MEDAVVSQGIAGEIIHLNPTKSIEYCLSDAHQKGYQTVVAVGDPKLVNKVAARLLRFDMVLGIIPLGEHLALLEKIGVSNWEEAIVALRQRRWQHAPLGHINNSNLFLTKAILDVSGRGEITVITADYQAKLTPATVTINTRTTANNEHQVVVRCEVVLQQKTGFGGWWQRFKHHDLPLSVSEFSADTLRLTSPEPINLIIDRTTIARTPIEFSVIPKALRLIVKKNPNIK